MDDEPAPMTKRSDVLRAASLELLQRSVDARRRSSELQQRSRMLAERRQVAPGVH